MKRSEVETVVQGIAAGTKLRLTFNNGDVPEDVSYLLGMLRNEVITMTPQDEALLQAAIVSRSWGNNEPILVLTATSNFPTDWFCSRMARPLIKLEVIRKKVLGLLFVDLLKNRADVMESDLCDRESHSITDENHPTKWMIYYDGNWLEEAQAEADLINRSLLWDLRFHGDSVAIVPTAIDESGERRDLHIRMLYHYVEWEVVETYSSYKEAEEAQVLLRGW